MRTQEKRSQAKTAYQKGTSGKLKLQPSALKPCPKPTRLGVCLSSCRGPAFFCVAFLHRGPGLSRGHALGKLAHTGNSQAQDLASIPKGSLIPVEDGPGRGGEGIDQDPAKI